MKTITHYIAIFIMMLSVELYAEDIKLSNGTVLKDASITKNEGNSVVITHADGISHIAYDLLPEDLRKKYEVQKSAEKAESERQVAAQKAEEEQKELKNISFKGLRIGMTFSEVDHLTKATEWGYEFKNSPIDRSISNQTIYLSPDLDADLRNQKHLTNEFQSIGSFGHQGEEFYCNWKDADVLFHDGRVYKIIINCPTYSAEEIDSVVQGWVNVAKKALETKYGNPQKTVLPVL